MVSPVVRVLVGRRVDQLDPVGEAVGGAPLPAEGQGVARRPAEHRNLARPDALVQDFGEAVAESTQVLTDHGQVVLTGDERSVLIGKTDPAGRERDIGDARRVGFLDRVGEGDPHVRVADDEVDPSLDQEPDVIRVDGGIAG